MMFHRTTAVASTGERSSETERALTASSTPAPAKHPQMTVVVQDLIDLAERCEKATGPDRRIDALIWKLQPCNLPDCLPDIKAKLIARILSGGDDSECPRYTGRTSDALSLISPQFYWLTGKGRNSPKEPLYAIQIIDAETRATVAQSESDLLEGCICAAALRARASIKGEG